MNRYLVLEAFADNEAGQELVKMQVLNIHTSITAAYWYWGAKGAEHRLMMIDLRKQQVYTWSTVRRLMFYENLKRLERGMRVSGHIMAALISANLVTATGELLAQGRELIAEYEPPPALQLALGHIKAQSRLHR